ncbi:MAG: dTMP kinase [Acidobacteria bacterium]|nr:dTMP kinase [Acidobacteriota bacterium]
MNRGKLITFEGVDGCGKTTQLRLLERILTTRNTSFVSTREPGGTELGKLIRAALLNVSRHKVEPLSELLLYAADRAQHVQEFVLPNLAAGKIVLSDRFYDATTAYQGYGRGFDLALIQKLNRLATSDLKPDLTLLFDIDVSTGIERIARRGGETANNSDEDKANRLDLEPHEFHERVRQGYLELAKQEPNRFRIIPASGSIEAVRPLVMEALQGIL